MNPVPLVVVIASCLAFSFTIFLARERVQLLIRARGRSRHQASRR